MHHRTSSPPLLGAVTARPVVLGVVLGLLAALVSLFLAPGPAPAAEPGRAPVEEEPLRMTLDEISPAVLRGGSDITLSGTVTNDSDETWTTVNVQSFVSAAPMTDADQLAVAADTPVDQYVGERVTEPGTFQTIPAIDPGQTVSFTAYVPREAIADQPGVYWIGVHARGQTETVVRQLAGRARTFLPVVDGRQRPIPASVVLPLRASIRHRPDGSVNDPAGWTERLEAGGRLSNVLEIGRAAGDSPLTWMVDPAVLHVVQRLAAGNPGTSLRPPPAPPGADPESDEPSPTPSDTIVVPTPDPDAEPGGDRDVPTPAEEAAAEAAQAWLTSFRDVIAGERVLALPYGDVDVSALAAADSALLEVAQQRSTEVMAELGIEAQPVLASQDGFLSAEAMARTPLESLVLLSDRAVEGARSGRLLGHPFVTISSGVADGGPGPEPAGSPVAVRQRVLSEAALQLLADDRSPLVVVPPATWDPDASADLAGSLDRGLVRWRPLAELVDTSAPALPDDALRTEEEADPGTAPEPGTEDGTGDETEPIVLPPTNVRAAEQLVSTAQLVEGMLAEPANVVVQTTDIALTDLSYFARRDPSAARLRTLRSASFLDRLLQSVRFDDQLRAVTLSGDSGKFGVTLVNPLDVAVVVDVRASASDSLRLDRAEPVRLAPRSRRRVLVNATVTRQGVHRLTLHITDATGAPLGSSTTISVRAAQVSGLLWFIMGGGLAILFGAIGVRLFRRVRAARRTTGTTEQGSVEA